MTGAGDMNRRLTLEAPTESDDGAGGVTRDYSAVATLWAAVTPVSARGDVEADSAGATLRFRIVIRCRADISTRHRFTESARVYRILTVRESADRRFLEIEADVRGD